METSRKFEHLCPCPFCHTAACSARELDQNMFAVCCDVCAAIGPAGQTEAQAVSAWNRNGLACLQEACSHGYGRLYAADCHPIP